MTLDKTPKWSFGKRKMIGTDKMIDLDTLPEAQAASIPALSGPVSQYQLDMFIPVDDGEAFIQDLHDEVLEDAREAEERAAAKRALMPKRLNKCLAEKGVNEIAPYVDSYNEVPSGDNHFLPAGDSCLLKLGSHVVRADPPIPVTGQLPRPIGKAYPVNQDWFDVCDLQSSNFLALVKEARRTPRDQLMLPMHATLRHVTNHSCTHKARLITILPTTLVDTQPLLRGWQLNPDGVPPAIRQEDDGTMNLLDVDIWMWVQVIAPKVAAPVFKQVIWKLFQQPGQWAVLVGNHRIPPPMEVTLRSSIRQPFDWGAHTVSTVPIGELAVWLAEYASITTERAQWLKHLAAQVALGEAHNGPAWASKPKKDAGEQHHVKMFPK